MKCYPSEGILPALRAVQHHSLVSEQAVFLLLLNAAWFLGQFLFAAGADHDGLGVFLYVYTRDC